MKKIFIYKQNWMDQSGLFVPRWVIRYWLGNHVKFKEFLSITEAEAFLRGLNGE
jgi:hypothetical protein